MNAIDISRIRNVALVGHPGAGTTALTEALLVRAGALVRPPRGSLGSLLDTDAESARAQQSYTVHLAPFEWTATDGLTYRVNLLDTPGTPDFAGHVDSALAVADRVVVAVSAVDGVEPMTEHWWRTAGALGLPRMVVVTKDDKDRADFHAVVDQLRERLGAGVVPLELPLGEGSTLHGVVDLLGETVHPDAEHSGSDASATLPPEMAEEERRLHDALVEEIVAGDDAQLEHYLAGDAVQVADLERTLAHAIADRTEFPVLVVSAATGAGVERLADLICELGPAPDWREVEGEDGSLLAADPTGPAVVQVFATVSDPYLGQLSLFRVRSGTVHGDDRLVNRRTHADERMHSLSRTCGKEQTSLSEVVAGDIAAVAKLVDTRSGDTLGAKATTWTAPHPASRPTVHSVAIAPRTRADDDKMSAALARLLAEDPSLRVDRNDITMQTVLSGLGDTHVAVAVAVLARKFGVAVDTREVKVAYRETVSAPARAEGKVRKQSGGHGQYAVVELSVTPLERGDGFLFTDATVGGSVPRQYLPAVEAGVVEAMAKGGVHGFPVVDVSVSCVDGKYHAVDSSDMAFRTAAATALREALDTAGVTVLEPVSHLTVTVPSALQGDVMGDITNRRGRVLGSTTDEHGDQVVEALVPAAELTRYSIDLRSLTGGRGRFEVRDDRYEALPAHLIEAAKKSLAA
ncbi:MAG: elongation factor G [Ilumatobacteraceae bacterium]